MMKTDDHKAQDGNEFTYTESLAEAVFAGVLYTIGYAALIVAIMNLIIVRPLPLAGLIGSLLWIAFIGSTVIPGCRKHGIRQHLVNVFGNFVRNRFAMICEKEGIETITFGYRFRGTRYRLLEVRTGGIREVNWGPGQGNDPKRDNCWNVAMWFDKNSILFDGSHSGCPLCIVGRSRKRQAQETFGTAFIAFLMANKVQLNLPPKTLVGQEGEVTESVWPHGRVRIMIGNEEHQANPLAQIRKVGTRVKVAEIRGTSIYVTPASE